MAKPKKFRYFMGDFETTVFEGQDYTEVWASATVELYKDEVKIFHSIDEQFDYLISLNSHIRMWYHNLKFDGSFWLPFLLGKLKLTQAIEYENEEESKGDWIEDKYMPNNSFKYSISDMGSWYMITIKVNNKYIEIRDSYKLLPFSVKAIGKAFKTKHQKLEMEYEGFRYSGCEITNEEKEYIANDVLVVKEAMEMMINDGHDRLTIGACALAEFKKDYKGVLWETYFPNHEEITLDKELYGSETADEYVRKSYRGGWCYVVPEKSNKVLTNGSTHDVNSLYPSEMEGDSGNIYPYGLPTFWSGNYIPPEVSMNTRFFFIRIKTRFYIRDGFLPFIQLKGNPLYSGNENLTSSDYVDKKTGESYTHYKNYNGDLVDTRQIMTMTMTDYQLFLKHYKPVELEILDGCWYEGAVGLFDNYIQLYKHQKLTTKGAKRTQAKLFLNNLYGKMSTSKKSSFKVARLEDGIIKYKTIVQEKKKVVYIPVGSAITSYARNFTIKGAQTNFHGADKRGFVYADTDSIHCDLPSDQIKGIEIHESDFRKWSVESQWDKAIFVRQKTYIERIIESDGEPVDEPYFEIKCAGMPARSKSIFNHSLNGTLPDEENITKFKQYEIDFMKEKRELTDFKVGLVVPGKLLPKQIKGGTILTPTTFKITPRNMFK